MECETVGCVQVRRNERLCRGFVTKFPAGEDQNTWVTLQGPSQSFRALYSKADSIIFDC